VKEEAGAGGGAGGAGGGGGGVRTREPLPAKCIPDAERVQRHPENTRRRPGRESEFTGRTT